MSDMQQSKVKRGGSWCSAINCTNSKSKHPDMTFFRFPKDPERSKRWVINSRRQDLDTKSAEQLQRGGYVLCSDHFEDHQFMNLQKKRLIHCAVPTLFDVPNKPKPLTPSRPPPKKRAVLVQSGPSQAEPDSAHFPQLSTENLPNQPSASGKGVMSPRKKALKKTILSLKKKIKRKDLKISKLEECIDTLKTETSIKSQLSQYVSGTTLDFLMTQIKVASASKHGVRWDPADKSLAMSLYHASPKSYSLLKKIFRLPSTKTLKRSMQAVNIKPGFCDSHGC